MDKIIKYIWRPNWPNFRFFSFSIHILRNSGVVKIRVKSYKYKMSHCTLFMTKNIFGFSTVEFLFLRNTQDYDKSQGLLTYHSHMTQDTYFSYLKQQVLVNHCTLFMTIKFFRFSTVECLFLRNTQDYDKSQGLLTYHSHMTQDTYFSYLIQPVLVDHCTLFMTKKFFRFSTIECLFLRNTYDYDKSQGLLTNHINVVQHTYIPYLYEQVSVNHCTLYWSTTVHFLGQPLYTFYEQKICPLFLRNT